MDARQLLSSFQARGIRLVPEGGNLAVEPASRLSDTDREAIRAAKPELLHILQSTEAPELLIEATFRVASASAPSETIDPAGFPPCPVCGATRYWISRGLVLCGSKRCHSAPRFVLTAIEFHAVQ